MTSKDLFLLPRPGFCQDVYIFIFFFSQSKREGKREKAKSFRYVYMRKEKETQTRRGWVISWRFPQHAHAFSSLFRKSALYCRVKFHKIQIRAVKHEGISEKLLKYWTSVKTPNLDLFILCFFFSSHSLALCLFVFVLLLLCRRRRHFGVSTLDVCYGSLLSACCFLASTFQVFSHRVLTERPISCFCNNLRQWVQHD